MEFSELIGSAWRLTWARRELWWLGFFAGTASGSLGGVSTNFSGTGGGTDQQRQALAQAFGPQTTSQISSALAQALPIIEALAAIVLLVMVLLWLLSVACRAAIIAGAGQVVLAAGPPLERAGASEAPTEPAVPGSQGAETAEPGTLRESTWPTGLPAGLQGSAWQAGQRAFGRLLLLDLLVLLVWLLVVGGLLAGLVAAVRGQRLEDVDWLGLLGLYGGLFGLVSLVGSVLGIAIAYAQRAVVLEGRSAWAGLGRGLGLLRRRPWMSLAVWLLGLALQLGGGIAIAIGCFLVLIPVGIVVALTFVVNQGAAGIGLAVLVGGVAIVLAVAILQTFLWHYWTLAYLQLRRG